MNIVASLFTALLAAAAGCVCAGFVMYHSLRWHRVSAREGAHGYAIIFIGLFGAVAGLILGFVISMLNDPAHAAGWARGLGYSLGAILALSATALAISYLRADHAPQLDGKAMELEVEVRSAPGVILAPGENDDTFGIFLYAVHRKHLRLPGRPGMSTRMLHWRLLKAEAGTGESAPADLLRCILPLDARVQRLLILRLGPLPEQIFPLPLASRPTNADHAWSPWKQAQSGQHAPLPPEQQVAVRYRARFAE